jgi:CelD/BcsL family acetyltransferase involved in cellulose biosynthesis
MHRCSGGILANLPMTILPTETIHTAEQASRNPSPEFRKQGMTLFRIDPLRDPRWESFVQWHPDASVFHRVEWLRALNSCYGYVPVVLSHSSPGSPLENGLAFCEVRSRLTGNRLVSLPFSDHCEPLVSNPEESNALMLGLADRNDPYWKYLEFRPLFRGPADHGKLAVSQTYFLHRLDLRRSEESLLKTFHKDSVRRKISRAERECLRYEEGCSDPLLKHFYRLLIITRRRQGLPPQPLKWFRSVIASMGKDLKIRVAFRGETPVASIITLTHKKTMVYKYGCSDHQFNNLGGTALLFWKAIQDAKASGIEELDMGRSATDNAGLIRFKEHWGAARSVVNYWRYPAQAASSHPEGLARYIKPLVSIAPDSSLVMLGNLLYRHIA